MKIHFIGIGGIGVSALAQFYISQNHTISGSDLAESEITKAMIKKGIKVFIGQNPENITPDIDVVVYSPAVKPENPEFAQAKKMGITLKSYPEALGELTHQYKTIAVSGSHGKSTTTSMLALALIKAGIDPTVIVGTRLKEFDNSNFRLGKSPYLVIEACEYDGSFLHYKPHIAVVTNIDKEHLDYFKTFKNVIAEFKKFIAKLPGDGFLVANKEDKYLMKISKGKFKTVYYGAKQPEAQKLKKILKVPGAHNVSNALAVLQVARILGIKDSITFKALAEFRGSWRRFEIIKEKPFWVISDYGHHPTEVRATLNAAREKFTKQKIWCIFQPHQHQRTFYLFKDFVRLFRQVAIDQLIITDIYDVAGREEQNINARVDSPMLVKKIGRSHVRYLPKEEALVLVKKEIKKGEVVIIMGAGDIYRLVDKF